MKRAVSHASKATRRALLRDGVVVAAALGVAMHGAGMLAGCAPAPAKPVDPNAPPLEGLTDFAGTPIPGPAIVGQVTVIDFWASWCGPCREGFRALDQLYRTFSGDGLQMIGVSVDDDPGAARRFSAALRPHFALGWDPSGGIRERFAVQGLPTTLLLDAEGRPVSRTEGFDTASHRGLEANVRRLLRGS